VDIAKHLIVIIASIRDRKTNVPHAVHRDESPRPDD